MFESVRGLDLIKTVGRLRKLADKIRKAIDEGRPEELVDIFMQYGASREDAEEFANMIVATVKESSGDVEVLKKNIVEFIAKRGAKREEVEDALEGLVTIIETVVKEVLKR